MMNQSGYAGKILEQFGNDLDIVMTLLQPHPVGIKRIVSRDFRGGKGVTDIMPIQPRDAVYDVTYDGNELEP